MSRFFHLSGKSRRYLRGPVSRKLQYTGCCLALLLVSGCASYGKIENLPVAGPTTGAGYSLRSFEKTETNSDLALLLAFSGGGTRAAALAYGVMQELRDTRVVINGESRRLLDEVDTISSVSGGSFTAAYYGLHGDGIFDKFEEVFLRHDLDKHLVYRLLNPGLWFGKKGRTDMAVDYYNKQVFHDATFADMVKPDMPLIVINASDLAYGIRFSFVQEYFDLLCSELASFPVARAVAASSAVPVMFNPVVLQNHAGCYNDNTAWLKQTELRDEANEELATLSYGLETYADKERRRYVHLVDGGITDNTGLRAAYDVIGIVGGLKEYLKLARKSAPSQLVVIAVNASTEPEFEMDDSNKAPSMTTTMNAVTGVQLHRYNTATINLVQTSLKSWSQQLSAPGHTVIPYFIEVSFQGIKTPELKHFLNKVPTAFSLSDDQTDALINSGRELLRDHPAFRKLLLDLKTSE